MKKIKAVKHKIFYAAAFVVGGIMSFNSAQDYDYTVSQGVDLSDLVQAKQVNADTYSGDGDGGPTGGDTAHDGQPNNGDGLSGLN